MARIGAMCRDFGQSPSDYFFNDLTCAHTRLLIDMEVWTILREQEEELLKKQEMKMKRESKARR